MNESFYSQLINNQISHITIQWKLGLDIIMSQIKLGKYNISQTNLTLIEWNTDYDHIHDGDNRITRPNPQHTPKQHLLNKSQWYNKWHRWLAINRVCEQQQ